MRIAFHTSCILGVPLSFLRTPDLSHQAYSKLAIAIPIIAQGTMPSKVLKLISAAMIFLSFAFDLDYRNRRFAQRLHVI
jgi:hypothetical protein